jgi:hypothetical protein
MHDSKHQTQEASLLRSAYIGQQEREYSEQTTKWEPTYVTGA